MMEIYFQYLPDDIVRYIIPFTYQVQKKELLQEIQHFSFHKNCFSFQEQNYFNHVIESAPGVYTFSFRY